jgi:GT2 family glycosyltransferase
MATFNRLELTKQSISSIIETASDNIPYMISVLDNGSTDGTPDYLKNLFDEKKIHNLVLMPKNIGISKAHNILWKHYDDIDCYAKIDNDVTFNKKNWLDDIMTILDHCPSVGVLGYNVESKNAYGVVGENGYRYRVKGGNIGGACFFIPKRTKERLGYWNEGFDLYGEEDADYGFRILITNNLKNAYMEDETVMNHLPDNDRGYMDFKVNQRKKNLDGILHKYQMQYRNNKDNSIYHNSNSINEIEHVFMTNIKE